MGLADRHYMREPEYPSGGTSGWSVNAKLMAGIVAAFVVQVIAQQSLGEARVTHYMALHLEGLRQGFIWQLLTFQFMHGGLMHLIFNLITIYFFGRPIEDALGGKRMLQLYLASGVVGGLLQMVAGWFLPQYFGGAVVGASAGAFGLVAAFATLYPDRLLTLLIFFIIPVSMRARTLLWISIGLAGLGILMHNDGIAHAAHLGGIMAGVAWIKYSAGLGVPVSFRLGFRRRNRPAEHAVAARPRRWTAAPPAEIEIPPEEFISREVDPILDKISQHGIHSLTDREKRILERARERMARR